MEPRRRKSAKSVATTAETILRSINEPYPEMLGGCCYLEVDEYIVESKGLRKLKFLTVEAGCSFLSCLLPPSLEFKPKAF